MSSTPPAATSGPAVSSGRGPIRWASAPTRAENSSISAVTGSTAVPAGSGSNPATTCRCSTSSTKTTPSAAYTSRVTALAAVNCREANSAGGTSGAGERRWTTAKPASATSPATTQPQTRGRVRARPPR
jgi:hypothetical protein